MKVCRDCQIEKPISDFYKHSQMFDGHLNKCIVCVKNRVLKHRQTNIDAIRKYDKERSKKPHRIQAKKDYEQTEKGKLTKKIAMKTYNAKHPLRYAAHIVVNNAIRDKKLIAQKNCSVCNSTTKIEGHHDDYTKPMDLRWLCEKCHKEWHKHNEPIYK
jgi:hypothetical protein